MMSPQGTPLSLLHRTLMLSEPSLTLVQKNNSYSASFEHTYIQLTETDSLEPVDSLRCVVYPI